MHSRMCQGRRFFKGKRPEPIRYTVIYRADAQQSPSVSLLSLSSGCRRCADCAGVNRAGSLKAPRCSYVSYGFLRSEQRSWSTPQLLPDFREFGLRMPGCYASGKHIWVCFSANSQHLRWHLHGSGLAEIPGIMPTDFVDVQQTC